MCHSRGARRHVLILALVGVAIFADAVLAVPPSAMRTASEASAASTASTPPPPHPVPVVAAENFWGNVAAQIGGRDVSVTSLITDPNTDPHLFETNAFDSAKLAQAQVVIENGAGYDKWMGALLGANNGHPRIVTAAAVLHVSGGNPNPHLWYDIPRVPAVAAAIAGELSKAAPRDAATFAANLATFDASLEPLNATLATIKKQFDHAPVAYTERVYGYLLADAGLHVTSPKGFAQSVEDGTDPSAADTLAMQRVLGHHDVDVLVYNVQTVTSVTTQIRALAKRNGIPVVGVSETLPSATTTYQQWQQSELDALQRALLASRGP
jgi:zinc/manganese transport system substrate-binding protein